MLPQKDKDFWLAKEQDILCDLVDCAAYGLVVHRPESSADLPADERCCLRRGVAELLVKAKQGLPDGHNFKIYCGWRSWAVQEALAAQVKARIQRAHPDWPPARLAAESARMAPLQRILPGYGWHRYGGAVDLTVVDAGGRELDMGVPVHYVEGPEAKLLFYEFKERLSPIERAFRGNRRILIRSLEEVGFEPYLSEFWHWRCHKDVF